MINRRDFIRAGCAAGAISLAPNFLDEAQAGLHLHGIGSAYEGLVASRARMMTTNDTTNKQLMGRYGLISTEALTSIRFVFSNFTSNSGADAGNGSASTITASIEYPAGIFTQLLFGGSTSGTMTSGGIIFSDYISIVIPANTTFWSRQFITNSSGLVYCNWQNSFFGEATNGAVSGLSDQTMGGTITNSLSSACSPPLAVLGTTVNPSVIIVGDSIGRGDGGNGEDTSNTVTGHNGKSGLITPSLGSIPFLNLSWPSVTAQNWVTNAPSRKQLISQGSHLISELGVNDLSNSRTSAQIITDLQAIWAFALGGQKIYQTTITPHSSSTDAWATIGNQTALNQATRATLNQAIRAVIFGAKGFYNTASILETAQDSDIWIASPAPPYTTDGLHPDAAGYSLVQSSGIISPVTWP